MSVVNTRTRSLGFTRKPLFVAIIAGLTAATPSLATAPASTIEELVVTAQKREENLQTTPLAITAMSGDMMAKQGITDFSGVVQSAPALSFSPYPSSSTTLILYIRGQGVSDPMQITSDGSVGLYSDGFYISRPQASTFDLADVERVEVLRGPQGTLYGRNTTGGAVNLISKKPTGEFGFKQAFTFGTRDYFRSLTSIDLPAIGDLSAKITALKSSKDGYVKNPGNSHDYGEEYQQAGRLSLQWNVTETIGIDYFFEMGNLDSTPVYFQNAWVERAYGPAGAVPVLPNYVNMGGPRSNAYRAVDLPLSTADYEGHGLTISWDPTDDLTIKSLTGYRELSFQSYQDYTEALFVGFASADDIGSHQFSQEFQFIGSAFDDRLEYLVGLYYFEESSSHTQDLSILLLPGVDVSTSARYVTAEGKSSAVFAQATWTPPVFDDRLSVIVGGRYTEDERSATRTFQRNYNGFPLPGEDGAFNDQDFSKFNPSLTVNFNWNDDLSTYAKVVTGYKAGGSSESGPIGSFNQTFDPEEVTSFELGFKSYWWDRRVRLNVAAYYSTFDDMQLAFVVDPVDASVIQSQNAGSATVKGGEVELTVIPVDDLTLKLDVSYLDAAFDEVEVLAGTVYDRQPAPGNPYSAYQAGDNVKNVFTMPYAPRTSVRASIDYIFHRFDNGEISANINYRWQDEQAVTANAGSAVSNYKYWWQPSYGVMDARITLSLDLPRGDEVTIGLWAKNILNKEYMAQVIGQGGSVDSPDQFGNFVPAGFSSQAQAWAEPPSYGVDVTYRY